MLYFFQIPHSKYLNIMLNWLNLKPFPYNFHLHLLLCMCNKYSL